MGEGEEGHEGVEVGKEEVEFEEFALVTYGFLELGKNFGGEVVACDGGDATRLAGWEARLACNGVGCSEVAELGVLLLVGEPAEDGEVAGVGADFSVTVEGIFGGAVVGVLVLEEVVDRVCVAIVPLKAEGQNVSPFFNTMTRDGFGIRTVPAGRTPSRTAGPIALYMLSKCSCVTVNCVVST